MAKQADRLIHCDNPRVGSMIMARYRIKEEASTVSIEVAEVGGRQEQLMQAFADCKVGHCTCPTDEYDKLASLEVEQDQDLIRLRLEPKAGEKLDTSEIAACLDYTTAKVAEPQQRS